MMYTTLLTSYLPINDGVDQVREEGVTKQPVYPTRQ
jgi:hypothetical protein